MFDEIKAIYRYRSAIVHGSHKASSRREITSEGKKIPASSIALAYLRMVIRLLLVMNDSWIQLLSIETSCSGNLRIGNRRALHNYPLQGTRPLLRF